jgi:mannose-1-phosphate guanylyltransferase/mannose-6-phosphate isomerase
MLNVVPKSTITSPIFPVILCGGSGTRLWPLSRAGFPKQFLILSGDDSQESLFQKAIIRAQTAIRSATDLAKTFIVTNEEHRFLALDQLRELKTIEATLLLEPAGRNTAPALTLAALCAMDSGNDPILFVTPADQTIQDQFAFEKAMQDALQIAQSGTIAILGITPTAPEIGYGYIEAQTASDGAMVVKRFVEKPDLATATQYVNDGGYYWNGGMFVLKASVWIAALKEFRPDILEATIKAWQGKTIDANGDAFFIRPEKKLFNAIPSESIDYAVIEKCPSSSFAIQMVPLEAGWNDLGAWDAVWQVGSHDEQGNVTRGDVVLEQTTNSLIYSSHRLVSTVGVNNLVVVETADAVLVADRANSQEVKAIIKRLEQDSRDEKNLHRKVSRPWGWYDSVDEGERFKVKRIQVKPGASLSLQMHHHRAEHWIVVKGIAEVTNGEKVIRLKENESTYIPQGEKHRLSNPGTEPLEIIEVQSGSYLGEDDIVRFEDIYKRT